MGQHNNVCFNNEVTETTTTTVADQAYLFQQVSAVPSMVLHSPSGDGLCTIFHLGLAVLWSRKADTSY